MAGPIKGSQKTVTTAGTAVALSSTKLLVSSMIIKAKKGNSGIIYVGDSEVSSSDNDGLERTESLNWESDGNAGALNMANQYIDASIDGEGVDIWYVEANR